MPLVAFTSDSNTKNERTALVPGNVKLKKLKNILTPLPHFLLFSSIPRMIELVTTYMLTMSIFVKCYHARHFGDRSALAGMPWIEEVLSMGGTNVGLVWRMWG